MALYTGNPSFDAAVQNFIEHAQRVYQEYRERMGFTNSIHDKDIFADKPSPKFIRIVQADCNGSSRSVYCFVDRENGNILFPKGWKGPAKNTPRGNVYDSSTFVCAGPHGVASLR